MLTAVLNLFALTYESSLKGNLAERCKPLRRGAGRALGQVSLFDRTLYSDDLCIKMYECFTLNERRCVTGRHFEELAVDPKNANLLD